MSESLLRSDPLFFPSEIARTKPNVANFGTHPFLNKAIVMAFISPKNISYVSSQLFAQASNKLHAGPRLTRFNGAGKLVALHHLSWKKSRFGIPS